MRVVDEAIEKHGRQRDPREVFKETYENPRGLPAAWIDKYLNRNPVQLAIDVIRVVDQNYQQEKTIKWQRRVIYCMGLIVSPLIGEVVKLLFQKLLK